MTITSKADWVPDEVVQFWNAFIIPGFRFSNAFSVYEKIDIDLFAGEERPGILAQREIARRSKLFEEVGPKLFIEFESGPEPKKLWEKITAAQNYSPTEFLCAVKDAYIGSLNRFDVMTPAQKSQWASDVSQAAHRLRGLISGTDADKIISENLAHIREKVFDILDENIKDVPIEVRSSIDNCFTNPKSDLSLALYLYELAEDPNKHREDIFEHLHKWDTRFDPNLSKPNDPHAHRMYFIRSITNFFYLKTKKPERRTVQTLVRALFDQDIDKRQIIDIAPTSPK